MANRLIGQTAQRVLLIGIVIVLAGLLLVPNANSQEPRTADFEIVFAEEAFEIVPALGNEPDEEAFMSRGDVLSGQAALYAPGDTDGERIGTFYFMGTGTADPEHADTAANHFYAQGYIELFNQGTLAIAGLVNFNTSYVVTITGGTGTFSSAGGHCTAIYGEENDIWSCDIR